MGLTQQTFLGASISNFNVSLGWNEQVGQLSVIVAEDPINGDHFIPPFTGEFVTFQYDAFIFGGIIQSWKEIESFSSNPTFQVDISDPRELLSGIQLIIGDYTGSVKAVPNLVNIYGYMESTGFGNAQVNDGGMPLSVISNGIALLLGVAGSLVVKNNPYVNVPSYLGQPFAVDLSAIPVFNGQYRVGGSSISILDLVSQLCADSSCDFFVQLVRGAIPVIKIRIVSRVFQPPLNQIQTFLNNTPDAISREHGQELRNDYTSSFLTGGNYQVLQVIEGSGSTPYDYSIWPFWGFDRQGNAMVGQNVRSKKLTAQAPLGLSQQWDGRIWYRGDAKNAGGWQTQSVTEIQPSKLPLEDMILPVAFYRRNDITTPPIGPNGDKLRYFPDLIGSMTYDAGKVTIDPDAFYYQGRGIPDRHGIFIDMSPMDSSDEFPHVVADLNELNNNSVVQFFNNANPDAQYGYEYFLSCAEMRAAIGGEDIWGTWNDLYPNQERLRILGAVPLFRNDETIGKLDDAVKALRAKPDMPNQIGDVVASTDVVNKTKGLLSQMSRNQDRVLHTMNELYEYVHMYATKFHGTKFMVRLPYNVTFKRNPETGDVQSNIEIADGGFLPEGSAPLGLPNYFEDIFTNEQGLFTPFARFNNASGLVFSHLGADQYAITPDSSVLYVKCSLDQGFCYTDWVAAADPRVVLSLPGPIYSKPSDTNILDAFYGAYADSVNAFRLKNQDGDPVDKVDVLNMKAILSQMATAPGTTNTFAGYQKQCVAPDAVAIPLKDNTQTYGPWWQFGADGKTRYEHDGSLVPWNYGGIDAMNTSASARLLETANYMTTSELGTITLPGSPSIDLGSALIESGPIVSNINVSVGLDGVTTTYSMRSYTPKYGIFARQNADRMVNQTRALQQQRRQINQLNRDASGPSFNAGAFKTSDEKNLLSDFRGRRDVRASMSPHEMLFMQSVNNIAFRNNSLDIAVDPSGNLKTIKGVFDTYNNVSSWFNTDPTIGNFNDAAKVAVSIDQLFAPFIPISGWNSFAGDDSRDYQGFFPQPYATGFISQDFEPFWPGMFMGTNLPTGGLFGDQYTSYRNVPDTSLMTPNQHYGAGYIALKTPLFLAGPGYTKQGRFFSGSGVQLNDPRTWRVGPLNVQWDEPNNQWLAATKPQVTLVIGNMAGTTTDGYGLASIGQYQVPFINPFNFPISTGTLLGLTVTQNGYYVVTNVPMAELDLVNTIAAQNGAVIVTTVPVNVHLGDDSLSFQNLNTDGLLHDPPTQSPVFPGLGF